MNLENVNLRKYSLPENGMSIAVSKLKLTVPAGIVSITINGKIIEVIKDEHVSWRLLDKEIRNMISNL